MTKALKERIAVSVYFFVNGFLYANLMARLPEAQTLLGINDSQLGGLLFCVAVGALVFMPLAGFWAGRIGSKKIVVSMAILYCITVPLLVLSQNLWLTGLCFTLAGGFMGAMDVTMNGQAVFIERKFQRPIITSFHAVFSIGMALGALTASLFSSKGVHLHYHLFILATGSLILIIVFSRLLLKEELSTKTEPGFVMPNKSIIPIGLVAFCSMIGEGSMVDWSSLYMNKIVGTSTIYSAYGFGAFAVGMTCGRLVGDYFTSLLGHKKLLLINTLVSIVGLTLLLVIPTFWVSIISFVIIGLGVATVVPIIYSIAGNTPGINPSAGVAMATSIGYAGFFIGPPSIGYISELYNLKAGLSVSLFLFVIMLFLIIKYVKSSHE